MGAEPGFEPPQCGRIVAGLSGGLASVSGESNEIETAFDERDAVSHRIGG